MHSHNATWNLLLAGQKKWFLVSPGHAKNISDGIFSSRMGASSSNKYSNLNNANDGNDTTIQLPLTMSEWMLQVLCFYTCIFVPFFETCIYLRANINM